MDNKRKADGEHPEDPEREDGRCMRTEGNKRKTVEEEEESMLRNAVKCLKTLERAQAKKESEETQKVVEMAVVAVNEEEVEWTTEGETQCQEEGGDLDPEQVRQGGEEEIEAVHFRVRRHALARRRPAAASVRISRSWVQTPGASDVRSVHRPV